MAAIATMNSAEGSARRLLAGVAIALTALGAAQLWSLIRFEPLGMDFLPLWVAGRMAWTEPGKIYDFAAVTAAQAWALPPHFQWLRPYPYPPTTLLLLAPLGRLPFWAANALWSLGSFGVFLYASARLAGRQVALAALLTAALPATVIAASAGQSVILAGGLIVVAVLELERRPRLAGALFALAAVAKPQAAIMAPVMLVACGALEALVSAGLVGACALALSAILFGPGRWSEWLAALPGFQQVILSVPRLAGAVITPLWTTRELGVQGLALTAAGAIFTLGGAWFAWTVGRTSSEPRYRVGALAVGSLTAAPYAMCYDAALLAPAAAALVIAGVGRGRPLLPLLGLAAVFEATTPHMGLVALAAFAVVLMADLRWAPAMAAGASAPSAPAIGVGRAAR